ncbi:hypothetical protein EIP91_003778 [Steccherinum ochraceum]|uniref:Protein kinase domain-containing protein n=1 Tax=Steccherinum ochraceum TaxID=92696 RepID=A0A4R0RQL7_9APHY|nr:hypothetical protein EIP91_003778 [Steccherinum ochraceum]
MPVALSTSLVNTVQTYIDAALGDVDDHTELPAFASPGDAQLILDETSPQNTSTVPSTLRSAITYLIEAGRDGYRSSTIILKGMECLSREEHAAGAYADVVCGSYGGVNVALKRVRVYTMMPDELKEELQKARILLCHGSWFLCVCSESILWKNLTPEHVLPFLRISNDVFQGAICMVIPCMEKGTLRNLVNNHSRARISNNLETFTRTSDEWLYQTSVALEYLHQECIIYADLHAGNILVDEHGSALLTDFGLALIADGTA